MKSNAKCTIQGAWFRGLGSPPKITGNPGNVTIR